MLSFFDALFLWIFIAALLFLPFYLLVLATKATQKMADWATTSQAPLPPPGGFQVVLPASTAQPTPVEPLPANAALRYAVLHHTAIPDPHYDLLLETTPGSPLATWRSPTWPPSPATPLSRLDDHRPDYLSYEGPVSNDRGHVTRVAAGTFSLDAQTPTTWELTLDTGARLSLHLPAGATHWIGGYAPT